MDEVTATVVSLAAQCVKGVQYHWTQYLCKKFFWDCREAQDEGKAFHYAWLLLLITLVTWRMLEESQFPQRESNLPEVAKFASLWATKYPVGVMETNIFWVLFEIELRTTIS